MGRNKKPKSEEISQAQSPATPPAAVVEQAPEAKLVTDPAEIEQLKNLEVIQETETTTEAPAQTEEELKEEADLKSKAEQAAEEREARLKKLGEDIQEALDKIKGRPLDPDMVTSVKNIVKNLSSAVGLQAKVYINKGRAVIVEVDNAELKLTV